MQQCPKISKRQALALIITLHGAFGGVVLPSAMALSQQSVTLAMAKRVARNTRPVLLQPMPRKRQPVIQMPYRTVSHASQRNPVILWNVLGMPAVASGSLT